MALPTNDQDDTMKVLENLIDGMFESYFEKDDGNSSPGPISTPSDPDLRGTDSTFSTIEEYKQVTGKRFRMTKEQKNRGLSRDEAFTETHLKD